MSTLPTRHADVKTTKLNPDKVPFKEKTPK